MDALATTRQGKLEGERYRGMRVFRGVPYAAPPTGERRFRPPEPPVAWHGTRPAVRFAPAAPQMMPVVPLLRQMIGGGGAGESEDCLYLNVWTPRADGGRRPVMVWIHGGAFAMGSGSAGIYSGRRLAEGGDVVVVTINYRLGALGGLNLRELLPGVEGAPSNLGIRDQIAALRWVRDNIEAFGGDPENVTIFGESAGGMSVGTLLGTPPAHGLFQRAVAQSGAAHNCSSPESARQVAEAFLAELGLRSPDLEALRLAPVSAILRAQRAISMRARMHGALVWQPSVDGEVLPRSPLDAIAHGSSRSVPVLIGTNEEEWKLFMLPDLQGLRLDRETLRERIAAALPGTAPDGSAWADRALEAYTEQRSASDTWVAFQTDRIFRYPATRLAELHAGHTPQTYAYLFTWAPPLGSRLVGSCHGLEIPFVFGTIRKRGLRPWLGASPASRRLSRAMLGAWAAFARNGRPDHAGIADWPAYDEDRRATMILGTRCAVEDAPLEAQRSFWESLL